MPAPGARPRQLRDELLQAGIELARAGGPERVVLREAARRVGVSHNAAYRHFANHAELTQTVAIHARGELGRLMQKDLTEVDPDDRSLHAARRRLRVIGAAYVRFAIEQPGLFRTAFTRPGLTDRYERETPPRRPPRPAL